MARSEGMALVAIAVIIAVCPYYDNKVSVFAKGLECKDVLTQATLEVSPLMLSQLCKDALKSTIVVTSGNTEWQDEVHGFCTSFDLNIGSVKMNHTLPKRSLAIQLVKNDITLDAALVSSGGSSYQGSHLISVWGHQNTRFVLKIVPVCSTPLQALDVKQGLPDIIVNSVANGKRRDKKMTTKPSKGIGSPFGPLDRSRPVGSTASSSLWNRRGYSKVHKMASGPNKLANVDYPRRRYRKRLDIAKDLHLAATQNENRIVSVQTTTESVAKAKLQWMEQKRLLFETKMEKLRNYVSNEDLYETRKPVHASSKIKHGNSFYMNNVDKSTESSEFVENRSRSTLQYADSENKDVTGDFGKPRANHRIVNKRDSSGAEEIRIIDEIATAGNESQYIPGPLDLKSSLLKASPESHYKLASGNFGHTEGTSNFNSSSLNSLAKGLTASSTAWTFFTQAPGNNILASVHDLDHSRQKVSESKNDDVELTKTLKLTLISQNENTKDTNTKIYTGPVQGLESHQSSHQPIYELPDSTNVKVLKDLHSSILVTKTYSQTNTKFLESHSIGDMGHLVSTMIDLSIQGTDSPVIISAQPVLFSDLDGSLISSGSYSRVASLKTETANIQPSSLFHSSAGDTFSSMAISSTDSPSPVIYSNPKIPLMSSELDPINGLTTPLSHYTIGIFSSSSITHSSNAQGSVVDATRTEKPSFSLAPEVMTKQSTSSHLSINSIPPRWDVSTVAETELLSRQQPRSSISADTRHLSKTDFLPSLIQHTPTLVIPALRSSAIIDTGLLSWPSTTTLNRDGPTLTPSFSAVSSSQRTSSQGNIGSKTSLNTDKISETSDNSSKLIKPSKPFEFMMSSDIHTTLNIDRSTSEPHENNDEEDISSDTLWPVVAALVVGIPSIIVFGIAITVIHRRRNPRPRKSFGMRSLHSTSSLTIGNALASRSRQSPATSARPSVTSGIRTTTLMMPKTRKAPS